ncbi:MAG: hypothetical protein ACO1OB_31970 [Archangium sp.]
MTTSLRRLALAALTLCSLSAFAQYNSFAGMNAPAAVSTESYTDATTGEKKQRTVEKRLEVKTDTHGNASGNQFDLAVDGAFDGQTIAVLHLYTGGGFDFSLPKAALKEKGFSVYRWVNQPPPPGELAKALEKSCQLWVISDATRKLSAEHIAVIKKFFDAGHGVYIWGDNQPYYADANAVGEALLGVKMQGDTFGDKTVGLQNEPTKAGVLRRHLLTTGLEYLYEGITIATVQKNETLTPLIYGSADNLVAGFFDKDGKRAIFDGGFTRLYMKWDTAGTARYVKNSAAWLVNVEKFGTASLTPTK